MKLKLKTILLSTALALAASTAQAGEWEGPYAGAFLGYISFPSMIAGVQAGYAFEIDEGIYLGPEVDSFYIASTGALAGSATARLGVAVSDEVLLYGRAGVFGFSSGASGWLAGGGAEVSLTDRVSLFAGADRYDCGCVYTVVRAGVQMRF
jgi:opacity protein-like surface antigen